jgi:hypothetical protein
MPELPGTNLTGLKFHHFGLAVREPASAFRYLQSLGYTPGHQAFDPLQRVNVAMRHHVEMPDVEVVWPGAGPSPIDNLVKRSGSLLYHLCYLSADVERALGTLNAAGLHVTTISAPQPAILFGGQKVSFYDIDEVGMIEIIESPLEPAALSS